MKQPDHPRIHHRPTLPAYERAKRQDVMPARCEHHACRCRRAAELAAMDRLQDAILCHYERVPCRARLT